MKATGGRPRPTPVTRAAQPSDVEAIEQVSRLAYQRYVYRIGREPAPMTADYVEAVTGGYAWVSEIDGVVVGVIVLRPRGNHLLIENVAVQPARHGSGIGGALMALAERRARALRLPEIRLYTNEAMTEVFTFYTRLGFTVTHRSTEEGYRRVYFSKPTGHDPGRVRH